MSRFSTFRLAWPARWATSLGSIDEEKHLSKDTLIVPTIVITPPPSPAFGYHPHSAGTSWLISEPDPLYLHPPLYLRPLYHNYLRTSRHRSLESRRRKGSWWWTLTAVILLLITSISLHGLYSIHSSEGRALDGLAAGLARQEPDEGASIPDVHGDPSVVFFHFELPRFLEWLAVDARRRFWVS